MQFNGMDYPADLCDAVEDYYRSYAHEIGLLEFSGQYMQAQLENKLSGYVVDLAADHSASLPGSVWVDLGCGLGGVVSELAARSITVLGMDVDHDALKIAGRRLETESRRTSSSGLLMASGESIPLADGSVDVLSSVTVIEHVTVPESYFAEAFRVLKSGGKMLVVAPNYYSFWEGHYRLWVPPYLMTVSKTLFRLYVRLFGRNPRYIDTLNFSINPISLHRLLADAGFSEIQDLSMIKMKNSLANPADLVDSSMGRMVKLFTRSRVLGSVLKFALFLLGKMKLYHPIVYIAKKPLSF